MTNVFDTAMYILNKLGTTSAMKLQKLVYYAQAWSLVMDDKPLFNNRIEAWANGPVTRDLYAAHRGMFAVSSQDFAKQATGEELTEDQRDTIDMVIESYGPRSAQWLSDQTHAESPWQEARKGLADTERGENEITLESMSDYYSSLK